MCTGAGAGAAMGSCKDKNIENGQFRKVNSKHIIFCHMVSRECKKGTV